MTEKQKQKFMVSQMEPKKFALHVLKSHYKEPRKEFGCLAQLWGKESAWNYKAKSPTDDYGIPQRHMRHNTKAEIADFMKHPHKQITWGINYIKHRYETPCGALKSWMSRAKNGRGGWY